MPDLPNSLSIGGVRTGQLLPTGHVIHWLALSDAKAVAASLVDAINSAVIMPSSSFIGSTCLPCDAAYPATLVRPKHVRCAGAEVMGLNPTAQALPKIAVVGVPKDTETDIEVAIQALWMGVLLE